MCSSPPPATRRRWSSPRAGAVTSRAAVTPWAPGQDSRGDQARPGPLQCACVCERMCVSSCVRGYICVSVRHPSEGRPGPPRSPLRSTFGPTRLPECNLPASLCPTPLCPRNLPPFPDPAPRPLTLVEIGACIVRPTHVRHRACRGAHFRHEHNGAQVHAQGHREPEQPPSHICTHRLACKCPSPTAPGLSPSSGSWASWCG